MMLPTATRTLPTHSRAFVASIPNLVQRKSTQPTAVGQVYQQCRYLHPEKRLEEARKKALELVKAQVAAKEKLEQQQRVIKRDQKHPEKRLEESRRKALEFVKAQVAQKEKEQQKQQSPDEKPMLTVCEANGHPDYRLRVKREEASKLEMSKNSLFKNTIPATSNNNIRMRLELGKEQARTRIKTFEPWVKPKRPIQVRIITSSEQPPERINDGTSSGAVAAKRLREKRQEALEKIMTMQEQSQQK